MGSLIPRKTNRIIATTWGPISWVYPAEVFPNKVRAKAVSLATASNWAWNTGLAFGVPPLLASINWKMYFIFATFNGVACIHMFLTAPETMGKTLEEVSSRAKVSLVRLVILTKIIDGRRL